MPKRIAVLVSGGGSNLQALLDAQQQGRLENGVIAAVLSSHAGAFALERAKGAGILAEVLDCPANCSPREMTVALVRRLRELDIDLVVMAGFLRIVTRELIDAFPNAILNVHPALIPAFSGAGCYGLKVHQQALACGVKVSGATVHFVWEECDAGPIVLQRAVDVHPDDSPETLQKRIMEQAEWVLLPRAVSLFCQDRLRVVGRVVHILDQSDAAL